MAHRRARYARLRLASLLAALLLGFEPLLLTGRAGVLPARCKRDSRGKARIIGDVHFADPLSRLSAVSGVKNALRADEGQNWDIGTVTTMKDQVTWHALEEAEVETGDRGSYGVHSVIHGGPSSFGPRPHTT